MDSCTCGAGYGKGRHWMLIRRACLLQLNFCPAFLKHMNAIPHWSGYSQIVELACLTLLQELLTLILLESTVVSC